MRRRGLIRRDNSELCKGFAVLVGCLRRPLTSHLFQYDKSEQSEPADEERVEVRDHATKEKGFSAENRSRIHTDFHPSDGVNHRTVTFHLGIIMRNDRDGD